MRVTSKIMQRSGCKDVCSVRLVTQEGRVKSTLVFPVHEAIVLVPPGFAQSEAGARAYAAKVWADLLPPDERPF